ncbi:MAG: biotin--[acetyl-CoA-carboxylase] ligase [Candidatus Obscuribacterales bacterium]|nr:biotin--[acetyl-CoA-carboxylase] ligase [Candidatus Obscuribacterales bacterium]
MQRFDFASIEAGLDTYIIGKAGKNELWDEIGSTNDRAIELAQNAAPEGVIVLARMQNGGRGRLGRSWLSVKDAGIFLSIILRPPLDQSVLPLISFVAGVAAAEAIENTVGMKIGLKWVNDLVYEGKKIGGILAEMPAARQANTERGDGVILPPAVILGMGINLALSADLIPEELIGKVESLDNICGKKIDANYLLSEFCNSLENQYKHLLHSAPELVLEQWKKYSATLGKRIKAQVGNIELEGIAEDLSDSGALVLRLDNGQERLLHAGEITIRLEDGRYA